MSRKTLKDFLLIPGNSYPTGAKMISLPPNLDADGNDNVDRLIGPKADLGIDPSTNNKLLSLGEEDVGLLGDYVEYITRNLYVFSDGTRRRGNKYDIAKKNIKSPPTARGEAITYDSLHGAKITFGTDVGDGIDSADVNHSDSGNFGKLKTRIIDKTGDIDGLDGHTLFKDLNAQVTDSLESTGDPNADRKKDDNRKILSETFKMLAASSRFSPKEADSAYTDRGIRNEVKTTIDSKSFALGQSSFGVNIKNKDDLPDKTSEYIFDDLKEIGTSMIKSAASDFKLGTSNLNASDVSAKLSENSPNKIKARGAFSSAKNQSIKSTLTNSERKFSDISSDQYTPAGDGTKNDFYELSKRFITILDNAVIDKKVRENNSIYTTHSYEDSVAKALEMYEDMFKEEYFVNIAKFLLDLPKVSSDPENAEETTKFMTARNEKIQKFIDTLAVLGDTALTLEFSSKYPTRKNGDRKLGSRWDVDELKEGPSTRVSKSKTNNGPNGRSLAWRGSSLPAIYHLPSSTIKSSQIMGQLSKKNPVKGMLAGGLGDKTYMAMDVHAEIQALKAGSSGPDGAKGRLTDGTSPPGVNKIPKALVEEFENRLEAEYVPFYFHDLRTNEIVSFHAFLGSLSDELSGGFGRMDPVHTYQGTTRNINFDFKVVSTSEQDFDEMWFKVNKLVTMLYPQWSAGDQMSVGVKGSSFTRPFSQIPVGSPMIRLRIGDVIKSNYSRFNLSRIFGSGNPSTVIHGDDVRNTSSVIGMLDLIPPLTGMNSVMQNLQTDITTIMLKVFLLAFGSPLQFIDLIPDELLAGDDFAGITDITKGIAYAIAFQALGEGFLGLPMRFATDRLRDPDGVDSKGLSFPASTLGAKIGDHVQLKPSMGSFYYSSNASDTDYKFFEKLHDIYEMAVNRPHNKNNNILKSNLGSNIDEKITKLTIDRHLKCKVVGRSKKVKGVTYFNVIALESSFGAGNPSSKLKGKIFHVRQGDFVIDPDHMFDNYFSWALDPMSTLIDKLQDVIDMFSSSIGIPADSINLFTTSFEDFMHPVNNSITKAFETSNGRGLAGFIESMSFDLIDSEGNIPWETSYGSRAPKILDIKMKFLPVHDISPGLDSDGFTRAPTHNVGSIMNNISDDPYNDGFNKGINKFTTEAEKSIKIFKNE
jgi:hypothetical protein